MSEKITSQLVIRIDPKLHRQFRHATIDHGSSMREVLEGAIDQYLRSRPRDGVAMSVDAGNDPSRV
jgi:hypothetical protein